MIADPVSDLPTQTAATYRRGPHLVALLAAVLTLPLLYVGGSVTTYRVGLAVPDWPRTFGINMFLYNFWNAPFGVRLEHTHRLYGAAVGMASVFLAVWFWPPRAATLAEGSGFRDPRGRDHAGNSGWNESDRGLDVPGRPPRLRSARVLRRSWWRCACSPAANGKTAPSRCPIRTSAAARGRAPCPRGRANRLWELAAALRDLDSRGRSRHVGSGDLGARAHARRPRRARARHTAGAGALRTALRLVSSVQMLLGAGAFAYLLPFDGTPRAVSFYQAVVRTGHQTNGAIVFAAAMVLTLRSFGRFRSPAGKGEASRTRASAAIDPEPRVLELEGAL